MSEVLVTLLAAGPRAISGGEGEARLLPLTEHIYFLVNDLPNVPGAVVGAGPAPEAYLQFA
jgi:hypothetical protein